MLLSPDLVLQPQELGQRVPELILLASMLIRVSRGRDQRVCCERLAVQKCLKDTDAVLQNSELAIQGSGNKICSTKGWDGDSICT